MMKPFIRGSALCSVLILCACAQQPSVKPESAPAAVEATAEAVALARVELALIETDMEALSRGAKRNDIGNPLRQISQYQVRLREFGANQSLPPGLRAEALYNSGMAAADINSLHVLGGGTAEESVARRGISDLESAIAVGQASKDWDMEDDANANFAAGQIAWNHLKDAQLAGRYWKKCADQGHAGCLNTVANAYLEGNFGFKVDIAASVRYHKQVVASGTKFNCAGVFSALSIATMVRFDGAKTQEGSAGYWVNTAEALRKELATEIGKPGACLWPQVVIYFNLLRAEQVESRQQGQSFNLEQLANAWQDPGKQALAGYILGKQQAGSLMTALPGNYSASDRCEVFFAAAWHAKLVRDFRSVSLFAERINALVPESASCSVSKRWMTALLAGQ